MLSTARPASSLPLARLAAFAAPALPLAAVGMPIATYLPPYYASELGLGLAVVGSIFMAGKLWDIVTDPLLGLMSDRIPTRFGRRRPWLVLGVPFLLGAGWLVFFPRRVLDGDATAGYLLSALLLLYIGFTCITIAHTTWGAELSSDYHERTRIQGAIYLATLIGMGLVLAGPVVIEQSGGTTTDRWKVEAMGWFLVLLLPPAVTTVLLTTPEPPARPSRPAGLRETLAVLGRNRLLQRLLVAEPAQRSFRLRLPAEGQQSAGVVDRQDSGR